MKKHLLVTVSDEKSALYGVKFISRLFKNKEDIQLTLFYTYSKSPIIWESHHRDNTYINHTRQYETKGKQALEEAKTELCKQGFREDCIDVKLDTRKKSTAQDILQEGSTGRYDAIVFGKRGVGWMEEAFEESVTKNLLNEKFEVPVWLCKLCDAKKNGILICVDGSSASLRMAHHVGWMLKNENPQTITLFTVNQNGGDSEKRLFAAKEQVLQNHFPEEMLKTLWVRDKNPAKAILKAAVQGNYGIVAMGRGDQSASQVKGMFFGSVSSYLFEKLEHSSLWICQ